jgi:hypothetical protein
MDTVAALRALEIAGNVFSGFYASHNVIDAMKSSRDAAPKSTDAPVDASTEEADVDDWKVSEWSTSMDAKNIEWHPTADEIASNFDNMMNKFVGGTWHLTAAKKVVQGVVANSASEPEASLDTIEMRLGQLIKYRANSKTELNIPHREFEVNVTHPFMCAVLEEAGKPLQGLVTADLHLYKEHHCSIKKERAKRNPDPAIFRDVDAVARRDTWMVAVAKRCMNNKGQADALVDSERDFVNVAGHVPSAEMLVGTSVFTDGVHW